MARDLVSEPVNRHRVKGAVELAAQEGTRPGPLAAISGSELDDGRLQGAFGWSWPVPGGMPNRPCDEPGVDCVEAGDGVAEVDREPFGQAGGDPEQLAFPA